MECCQFIRENQKPVLDGLCCVCVFKDTKVQAAPQLFFSLPLFPHKKPSPSPAVWCYPASCFCTSRWRSFAEVVAPSCPICCASCSASQAVLQNPKDPFFFRGCGLKRIENYFFARIGFFSNCARARRELFEWKMVFGVPLPLPRCGGIWVIPSGYRCNREYYWVVIECKWIGNGVDIEWYQVE